MERIYTIPLRDIKRVPKTKRAAKAVRYIEEYLKKHMKGNVIIIDKKLNDKMWERGIRGMPPRIKVKAEKLEDESILATLP